LTLIQCFDLPPDTAARDALRQSPPAPSCTRRRRGPARSRRARRGSRRCPRACARGGVRGWPCVGEAAACRSSSPSARMSNAQSWTSSLCLVPAASGAICLAGPIRGPFPRTSELQCGTGVRRNTAGGAGQQPYAKPLLKIPNRLAQSRLRNSQPCGRSSEASLPGHRQKGK